MKLFQKLFLPASLIGGFIGLIPTNMVGIWGVLPERLIDGVLAVGLLLLRIVDPDYETSAPKTFAFERPFLVFLLEAD